MVLGPALRSPGLRSLRPWVPQTAARRGALFGAFGQRGSFSQSRLTGTSPIRLLFHAGGALSNPCERAVLSGCLSPAALSVWCRVVSGAGSSGARDLRSVGVLFLLGWARSTARSIRAWLYLTLRGRGVCPVACYSGRGSIGCLRGLVGSAAAGWLALGPPGLGGRGARRGCRGGRSVRCTTRATDSVPAGLASGAWSVQRAPPHGPFLGGVLCLARSHGRRI